MPTPGTDPGVSPGIGVPRLDSGSTSTPGAFAPEHYANPGWLRGAHAQTIYAALLAPRPRVAYRRECWNLPDGDFLDADFAFDPEGAAPDDSAPLVVLLHGLEGSSHSHYSMATMHEVLRRGWRGVVVHWRGCGGEINLAPRAYHSGETGDVDWALRRLAARQGRDTKRFVIGISLGGNALLKWLGEQGSAASSIIDGAAAVSAPHDLHAGARALSHGFNLLYAQNFLRSLKRKSLSKLIQFPGLFDRERMMAARTFFDFDDAVTAPLHGFADCYDYWERCSSRRFVGGIRTPTLIVNARNDPFLPAAALIDPGTLPAAVQAFYPDTGGHAGFVTGDFRGRIDWIPRQALSFFVPLCS